MIARRLMPVFILCLAAAWSTLALAQRRAAGTGIRVIWQYAVFRWNDRDDQCRRAIAMAQELGIPIWFNFAHTWGRSKRSRQSPGQTTEGAVLATIRLADLM